MDDPKTDLVIETDSGYTAEFHGVTIDDAADIVSAVLDDDYDDLDHVTIEVAPFDDDYEGEGLA